MTVVQVDLDPQGIATLTINRPEALNALNGAVIDALAQATVDLRGRAKAIIVTGAGKAFVAGADIAAMANLAPIEAEAFALRGQALGAAFANFAGPVIAAVNGFALGGGLELAMCCDIILASDKAKVGQPEVKLGVVPGFGGSQRLPRRTGPGVAKWLLMTGDTLGAEDAFKLGVVDKVVPHDTLLAEAKAMAATCLKNGPQAIHTAKMLVDAGLNQSLPDALHMEAEAFGMCFSTSDQKEGMAAFLQKRAANWTGH